MRSAAPPTARPAAVRSATAQSLGLTEVAYQNALVYAKDRIQMRSLSGPKNPDLPVALEVDAADERLKLGRPEADRQRADEDRRD